MIISASRRTDIPNYFSAWFFQRIKEGYVLIKNPMNPRQISKVSLSPQVVDGIIFWTKNPLPMMGRLKGLKDYPYYFQFTLNDYGSEIEPGIPEREKILEIFQRLAEITGREKVIWRYDPILINSRYSIDYHLDRFEKLSRKLKDCTSKCVISFIDPYRNTARYGEILKLSQVSEEDKIRLAAGIGQIAAGYGLGVETCAEGMDLEQYGIKHGKCIDDQWLEQISGYPLEIGKDKNQRLECGCAASIDIGAYNTCGNECRYCYANFLSSGQVRAKIVEHDSRSPLLSGEMPEMAGIRERKVKSNRKEQTLF